MSTHHRSAPKTHLILKTEASQLRKFMDIWVSQLIILGCLRREWNKPPSHTLLKPRQLHTTIPHHCDPTSMLFHRRRETKPPKLPGMQFWGLTSLRSFRNHSGKPLPLYFRKPQQPCPQWTSATASAHWPNFIDPCCSEACRHICCWNGTIDLYVARIGVYMMSRVIDKKKTYRMIFDMWDIKSREQKQQMLKSNS